MEILLSGFFQVEGFGSLLAERSWIPSPKSAGIWVICPNMYARGRVVEAGRLVILVVMLWMDKILHQFGWLDSY